MGDFHQSGEVTTLHRFGNRDIAKLEAEIKKALTSEANCSRITDNFYRTGRYCITQNY